jgi:hypothetical protein
MAHIANFMVSPTRENSIGLNNYIARELSSQTSVEPVCIFILQSCLALTAIQILDTAVAEDLRKERSISRMQQPSSTRKYQLFPAKDRLLSITPVQNNPDPEQAFAIAMGNLHNTSDRTPVGTAMRLQAKKITLIRRPEPSVSELGSTTIVQEVATDSRKSWTSFSFGHILRSYSHNTWTTCTS